MRDICGVCEGLVGYDCTCIQEKKNGIIGRTVSDGEGGAVRLDAGVAVAHGGVSQPTQVTDGRDVRIDAAG